MSDLQNPAEKSLLKQLHELNEEHLRLSEENITLRHIIRDLLQAGIMTDEGGDEGWYSQELKQLIDRAERASA